MHEALCRSSGTILDILHDEDGPPITQRTSGLARSDTQAGPNKAVPAGWIRRIVDARFAMQ